MEMKEDGAQEEGEKRTGRKTGRWERKKRRAWKGR